MKPKSKFSISAFLIICCLSFVFLAASEGSEPVQLKGKQPCNVILIIIDDLRPDHLGCYGYQKQTSPAIDDIAKDSCIFENAFSQAGYTFASTMSILTSLYPVSHGMRTVCKDKLSPRVQTMAEIFSLYGYKTAWFSVLKEQHLDIDAGFGRGFQDKVELGILFNGRDELLSWLKKNKDNKFFLAMDSRRVHDYPSFFYRTSLKDNSSRGEKTSYTEFEEANKIFYHKLVKLARSRKPPLDDPRISSEHKELFNGTYSREKIGQILGLANPEKRYLLQALRAGSSASLAKKVARQNPKAWIAAYDACIQATDKELIKPIEDELKALGLYDKTMLVITADHGEAFGEHGLYGHGYAFFDEFYHVPLIIKMPYSKQGKKIPGLTQSIDIMPTALEMCGIQVPHQAQGKSLVSFMTGANTSAPHEYTFEDTLGVDSIRSQEWKLLVGHNGKKTLFHLSLDPQEQHNVYSKNKPIAKKLEEELKKWESTLISYADKEYPFAPEIDKTGQERIRKTGYW